MNQAIEYAATEWNVDIISMSFGFRGRVDEVRKVVDMYCTKKIMVAAASNNGGNFGRAYPADDLNVICMHSTDGQGNRSNFSPSNQEDRFNFSILGKSVESLWPKGLDGCEDDVRPCSGTSVATPIAAGIAATVLAFARHHLQQKYSELGDARLVDWLNTPRGMAVVFKLMVEHKRDDYDYITPWTLFKITHQTTNESAEENKKQSVHIYRSIIEKLKEVFG
jgi:hypothetical protein